MDFPLEIIPGERGRETPYMRYIGMYGLRGVWLLNGFGQQKG